MLNFEYFPVDGNTVAAGVFIPVAALPGLSAAELDGADPIARDSKVALAIISTLHEFNALFLINAGFPMLGFSTLKAVPAGTGIDVWNQTYTVNTTLMGNYKSNSLSPIPMPTTGDRAAFDIPSLVLIFPGLAKLGVGVPTGGAGILVSSTELLNYGIASHANIDENADSRAWIFALINYIINAAEKRGTAGRSAVISAAKTGNSIFTPPAAFTDPINPISGVLAADLPLRVFIGTAYNIVIQFKADQNNQTFDANVLPA